MKITFDADKQYVLLIGTSAGKVKIYGLPGNDRRGVLSPHDCVTGFLAWDGECFMSAGTEGGLNVWLWKSLKTSVLGMPPLAAPTMSGLGGMMQ